MWKGHLIRRWSLPVPHQDAESEIDAQDDVEIDQCR